MVSDSLTSPRSKLYLPLYDQVHDNSQNNYCGGTNVALANNMIQD